jgi:hypothetical protein
LLGALWNLAAGINLWDEGWYLQVIARVRAGEVLYRDVYFGPTPLSVQLSVLATQAFGVEIGVVKGLRVLCFAASTLLACRLAYQVTGRHRYAPGVIAACLLYAAPDPKALYTPLAETLALATSSLALAWRQARLAADREDAWHATRLLVAAGACAGLCFATKQNVGALALAALAATIALTRRAGPTALARRLVALGLAFSAAVATVLAPLVVEGALGRLIDYGVIGRRSYLEHSGISYFKGLRALARATRRLLTAGDPGGFFFERQAFLLPFLAVALLPIAVRSADREQRRVLAITACFATASFATAFPRADPSHVIHFVPAVVVLLVASWHLCGGTRGGRRARAIELFAMAWLGLGLAVTFGHALAPVVRGERVWSSLPSFHGALLEPHSLRHWQQRAPQLAAAFGEEALIVSPRAGFLYLVTGARNPTPFDWLSVNNVDGRDEAELIGAIARGAIPVACVDPEDWGLNPRRLEQAIRDHLERVADLGPCVLYRRPGGDARGETPRCHALGRQIVAGSIERIEARPPGRRAVGARLVDILVAPLHAAEVAVVGERRLVRGRTARAPRECDGEPRRAPQGSSRLASPPPPSRSHVSLLAAARRLTQDGSGRPTAISGQSPRGADAARRAGCPRARSSRPRSGCRDGRAPRTRGSLRRRRGRGRRASARRRSPRRAQRAGRRSRSARGR